MLKTLTYNIKSCRGINGLGSLTAIAQTIAASKADIAGLQEVDYLNPRSGFTAQARKISGLLNMHYVFGANTRWFWLAQLGNAVISRYPIIAAKNFPLASSGEPRGLLVADIDMGLHRIIFATTHLGLNQKERLQQIKEIKNLIQYHSYPLILTGDFNALPDAQEIEKMQAMLQSVDPTGTWPTFPSTAPKYKIDDIFYSRHWRLMSYQVHHSLASDHLPCLATFNLKNHLKQDHFKLLNL